MDTIFIEDSYNLGLFCIREGTSYSLTGTDYTVQLLRNIEKLIKEYEYTKIELNISKEDVIERLLAFHRDGYILELEYKGHESGWHKYAQYKLIHLYETEDSFKYKASLVGFDKVTMDILENIISSGKCNQLF